MRTGVVRLGALVAAGALLASGCSASRAAGNQPRAGQFHYVAATVKGSVILAGSRKQAAAIRGALLTGGNYASVDHRGRVVVVNYWATWCAPCVLESPMLDRVYRQTHPSGVDFVGIDVKDEKQAAQSFVKDKKISYPIVYDEPVKTALQLGIPSGGLPVTAVIDRAGRVAAIYLGAVQYADIRPVVVKLAAES